MRKRIIAAFIAVASPAQAQRPTEVKDPTKVPSLLQQYDFGAQVKMLQNPDPVSPASTKPRFVEPSDPPAPAPLLTVPKDLHPKDVPGTPGIPLKVATPRNPTLRRLSPLHNLRLRRSQGFQFSDERRNLFVSLNSAELLLCD